jgi:cysteine desulfurase
MSETPIYMDHHATTAVDERVLAAMLPYFVTRFGNAASRPHAHGKSALDAVELARAQVARLLGAKPGEVIFTSGATESDNLGIQGLAEARLGDGKHVVTVRTEHRAVLDSCAALERRGWRVTLLEVDRHGLLSPDAVAEALTDETVLVSVMLANNEIGVVQDLAALGALTAERDITFHCDAAQGLGYLPFSVDRMNIDLASISAHKMYGPKGVGALYVRDSLLRRGRPAPQMYGGGHERGLRPGTLNVPGIVGFGAAAEIMLNEGNAEAARVASLRDDLKDRIVEGLDEVQLNGAPSPRHPGNLNLSFGYVDGARLLLELCEVVSVSSGSACSSAKAGPSHVLESMGVPKDLSAASIRFGLGRHTSAAEVQTVADAVIGIVRGLRKHSPSWARWLSGKRVDW